MYCFDYEDTYKEVCENLGKWREDLKEKYPVGEWEFTSYDDLKVDDFIYVDYMTDSQKYMYIYTPIWGKVVKTGPRIVDVEIDFPEEGIRSIHKEGCHVTGYCKGFSYTIYRYNIVN